MYKIGEFSKITGLTVKALRYYDELGILLPSERDDKTSYRFYNESDLVRAELISVLRSLDFSIAEVKDILSGYEGEEDLYFFLREKQDMIRKNISAEKKQLERIEGILKPSFKYADFSYDVHMIEVRAIDVISVRFLGRYTDLDRYVPLLYRIAKGECGGRHFSCYYDCEFKENADIELCLPVKHKLLHPDVEFKSLPPLRAIAVKHVGAYDKLGHAYKALYQYAGKHSLRLLSPSREIYIKGPGAIFKGNPNKYVTEVVIPFQV